jgi:hypothetical protein
MLIWGHNPTASQCITILVHHFCEDIMWFQDAHSGHNPVSQGSDAHNDTIVIVLSLRATSLTRLRARDHYTSSTLIGGNGGSGPSLFHTTLEDQRSMWMQDGCEVYMDSDMASNGSCFMVTWTIFKNHLLQGGLTQNRETMTIWMLTTVDLFYFIMCEDPRE